MMGLAKRAGPVTQVARLAGGVGRAAKAIIALHPCSMMEALQNFFKLQSRQLRRPRERYTIAIRPVQASLILL